MFKKTRGCLTATPGLAGCLLALSLLWVGTAYTQEKKASPAPQELKLKGEETGHFIIRVKEGEGLIPKQVNVTVGTTVIWLNRTGDYIEITFTGDQKVDVACKAPVHFVLGRDGAYISDKIPFGAVASLCFIEKGTYKYTASATAFYRGGGLVTREKLQGTIIVE